MADVDFNLSDISVISPENDVFVLVVISSLSLLGLFLYDDLYPSQLRGRGPGGSEVTIPACPQFGSEVITSFDQTAIMTPELNPCFYYISVRGFDRLLIISTILFGGFYHIANQDPDEQYCGSVGLQEYCFAPCPVTSEGTVTRSWAQFTCYVYNNGKPDQPGLTPLDVQNLYFSTLIRPPNLPTALSTALGPPTTVDPSNGGRCGDVAATPTMENFAYCLDMCVQHSFTPSSQGSPPPCFYRYRGSPGEILTSFLSSLLEPVMVENERTYCPFDDLEVSGTVAVTLADGTVNNIEQLHCARNQERLCRADSRGVWQLPPR